jgi:hypothetical protein
MKVEEFGRFEIPFLHSSHQSHSSFFMGLLLHSREFLDRATALDRRTGRSGEVWLAPALPDPIESK